MGRRKVNTDGEMDLMVSNEPFMGDNEGPQTKDGRKKWRCLSSDQVKGLATLILPMVVARVAIERLLGASERQAMRTSAGGFSVTCLVH